MKYTCKLLTALLGGLCLSLTALGSAAFAASVTAFDTDFNAGAPPEFSGVTTTESVQGYAGLGTGLDVFSGNFLRNTTGNNFGGGPPPVKTTLTLTDLPVHTSINVKFLLAIIDSWDGGGCFAGPDIFNVTVDGLPIFSQAFKNSGCGTQTYVPPPGVQLARRQQLGFTSGGFFADSAYNMGLDPTFSDIPHTSSTLTVEWFASGTGWQGDGDESWAIDNVEVVLNLSVEDQLTNLANLIHGFGLLPGIENSLLAKVAAAQDSVARGDTTAACNQLQALINEAQAQSDKHLTAAQATAIIIAAQTIRTDLGCP